MPYSVICQVSRGPSSPLTSFWWYRRGGGNLFLSYHHREVPPQPAIRVGVSSPGEGGGSEACCSCCRSCCCCRSSCSSKAACSRSVSLGTMISTSLGWVVLPRWLGWRLGSRRGGAWPIASRLAWYGFRHCSLWTETCPERSTR